MSEEITLSIIIVSFNTKSVLKNCVNSLIEDLGVIKYEIIIVDNNSSDGSVDLIRRISKKHHEIKPIYNRENLGFARGNNLGMKKSSGKYILLLNSDTTVNGGVVGDVVDWMESNPKYGVASPNLYNKDGSVQGTGGYFPNLIRVFSWMTVQDLPFVDLIIKPFHPMKTKSFMKGYGFFKKERDLDWVTGAFMMIRGAVYKSIGGFDEDFFMYTEEVEYCMRIKQSGWLIKYLPYPGVTHLGGASGKPGQSVLSEFNSLKLLYKKHYPEWQFPILRLLFKLGCLWRIPIMGIINGKEAARLYAKAFASV